MQEMMSYIISHQKYPILAEEQGITGKVSIQIVVNGEGKLIRAIIKESAHPILDKEAIRVIRSISKWSPAKIKKEPVASSMFVSMTFSQQ